MKKILFFSLALLVSMHTLADDSWYNTNAATATGVTTSASSGTATASQAVDNNTGTRWESAQSDPQTWQMDLGSVQSINGLQIVWEGAYGKTFNVYGATTMTNGTDPDWDTTNPIVSVTDQVLTGFPNTQSFQMYNTSKNVRYVKFVGTARGTGYGYSFWEFRTFSYGTVNSTATASDVSSIKVELKGAAYGAKCPIVAAAYDASGNVVPGLTFTYKADGTDLTADADGQYYFTPSTIGDHNITVTAAGSSVVGTYSYSIAAPVLTTFTIAPAAAAEKVGTSDAITVTAKDQYGNDFSTDGISYAVSGITGTFSGNSFTPSASGLATITATLSGKTATCTVSGYDGDNLAIGKLVDNSGYAGAGYEAELAVDGNDGTRWGSNKPTPYTNTFDAYLTLDLGAYYDINLVEILFENANASDYTIQYSKNGTDWTKAYEVTGLAGFKGGNYQYCNSALTDGKQFRFVKFLSTKAATDYGVSIYEFRVFGSNKTDIPDVTAPTLDVASVASYDYSSATLNLKATDDVSSITYEITDKASGTVYTTTGASAKAITYTISGLSDNTAYTFSVVAKDSKGNASAATEVAVTTAAMAKPATSAPVPTVAPANVISVYSDAYVSATPNVFFANWGAVTTGTKYKISNTDECFLIKNFNYFGFEFGKTIEVSSKTYLHVDIYPEKDMSMKIYPICGGAEQFQAVTVTGNQWNSIDLPVATYTAAGLNMDNNYQFKFDSGDSKSLFYVDNIYYYSAAATTLTNSGTDITTNAQQLVGTWDAETFATIDNTAKAVSYDMRGVTIPSGTTIASTSNANALFIVAPGQKDNISNTANVVVYDGTNYKSNNIVFTDGNDINTSLNITATSAAYNRTLAAGAYGTTVVPFNCAVPTGFTAYALNSYSYDASTKVEKMNFTSVDQLTANTPYILYSGTSTTDNCTASEASISFATTSIDKTSGDYTAKFVPNYSTKNVASADNIYVLEKNATTGTLKHALDGSTIPAFRAYFIMPTLPTDARSISVTFGDATGINAAPAAALNTIFNVYSIDGRTVVRGASSDKALIGLQKGIYIINGKKTVIK